MPNRKFADIVCYEEGSDGSESWCGSRENLAPDFPALEKHCRRGLIFLDVDGDNVRIRGHDRVGLVVLPSSRRLLIRSKISGLTMLDWLAYLGRFPPLDRWLSETGVVAKAIEQDDWHQCIARLFLFALEDVTRWHVRKDYEPIAIDEPIIRGRVLTGKLVQRIAYLPRIPQITRSRTIDVDFNIVLAKALDRVPVLLKTDQTDDQRRMVQLRDEWSDVRRDIADPIAAVTAAQWTAPPGYRVALQLAHLILVGAVADPQSNMGGQAFTISLSTIWENALRQMCDELAETTGWHLAPSVDHTRHWDDSAGSNDTNRRLNADIILQKLGERWVLDAKYKSDFGNENRNDRFQICAYAIAFNASRASLVYPSAKKIGILKRNILVTNVGGQRIQIDSIGLPMAEGPGVCRDQLAQAVTTTIMDSQQLAMVHSQ